MRQAEQKGLQGKQALAYGTIMGALESGTEWLGGELTKGVGKAGKELLKATGKKEIKNQALKALGSYGLDIGENFFEEAIMEPLEEVVTQATGGKADYSNIKARMIQSGIDGALTSILMGGASAGIGSAVGVMQKAENGQEVTQEEIKKALTDINKSEELDIEKMLVDNFNFNPQDFVDVTEVNQARDAKMEQVASEMTNDERKNIIMGSDLDDRQKETLSEIAEKYQLSADDIQKAIDKTKNGEYAQKQQATMENTESLQENKQTTQNENKTAQNETSSEITTNLMRSIDNYNNSRQEGEKIFDINDENTRKKIESIQKIAEKRGVNITFDESRFDSSDTNAFYEYDEKGNVANIVLNPNSTSKKYVENLAIHEMTHSFEGSKEYGKLSRAVLDYAKRTGEYDKAFEDLKATYEKVYGNSANLDSIVEKEAVANILGEKLGDQEFVNDLVNGTYSTENKSLVQKIYDFVKNQINRFKGYKDQEQYWNHVKELFDTAMNKSEISQEGLKASKEATAMTNIKDSQGRQLSQGQVDYFKDSKVRDDNGNLLEVYHGTNKDFNIFDKSKSGNNYEGWSRSGKGFYFTANIEQAKNWGDSAKGEGKTNVKKVYLDIKNPFGMYKNYTEELQSLKEKYNLDDFTLKSGYRIVKALQEQGIDSTEVLQEYGFDGIIEDLNNIKKSSDIVVFNPNQIKNTDNLNPTENNDIRYSIDGDGKDYFYRGQEKEGKDLSYNSTGFMGLKDGGYYFTPNKETANKYGNNIIERYRNEENTVTVKESDELQKMATEKLNEHMKQGIWTEEDDLLEQMSLGRSKAFAEYTGKPFVETGDKFGEDAEAIYYPEFDKESNTKTSTKDSQGRTLSKEQQDYFKNSENRNEKNELKTMYRGSPTEVNIFEKGGKGKRYTNFGTEYEADVKGFFFTENEQYAKEFGDTTEYYLNTEKILRLNDNIEDLNKIFKPMLDEMLKNQDISQSQYDAIIENGTTYKRFIDENGVDWETVDEDAFNDSIKIMQDLGYDSIEVNEGNDEKSIMIFESNQAKRTDNLNPTDNPDTRYSKDTTGAWNNFIEKYFKNEGTGTAIKDMKKLPVKTYSMQDIDNVLNETTLSDELKEEFRNDLKGKTITKEIFNEYKDAIKQVEKDYENYNAERKPSWDDIGEVFEQPSEEVESPLQDRNIETIGKETKKNAYQYENPEVKPYFQEMAQMIGEDLAYASDPINRKTKKGGGTELLSNTKAINDLHNKYGYSYEQIGIGLNNIIEDNGAENNAVSKKIEFYIDDALRNGYRNIQGQYIQPNQDYINTIQYSMETENQAEKIEEEKPKPKVLNPTQISNLTLEDVSTTPKLPNKKYKEGSKVSSFVSNIENDVGFLNEEEKQELLKDDNVKYYAEITNADTLAKAYDNLKENGKDATIKWYAKPTANATAEDVATGWILLKQYSDKGDTEGMVNVAKKLRDMGTKAGQTVQAFNILSRLTPEGMVAYTQGELQDAYNEMIKGKSKKWIDQHKSDFDLSQDEIAFIMDTMQNLPAEDPTNNNYDRKVALGQIQKLFTDKIPPENNKIKAWMRISMLFNPKTQVRNVAGNAGVIPVNMTSDFLGSKVDKVLSKYTGVRTLGNPNAKAYLKGMKEGFYQSYNDFKLGINTRDIEQNKFEFGQGKAFKDKGIGKALNRVDNMLNFIMDFGDRGFSQASFVNSLNNQMLLNGVTTPTQDMIDIATQESLSRTWNDNNEYTKFVLGVRRALNKVGTKNYGLGDVLIPFAKTPANLTKAIVEYSPVGLTKQILNIKGIKNAIETDQFTAQQQHDFADKMGKGLAGTLLYIAGYALAQAGIATGEPDEDKDVKNFMKNSLGIAPYSIKIGDKSFTYDWAQPVATPLAIMTNLYQTNKNNPDATMLDKIMSATNIGTNQLMEQSFMESLNEVLNGNGEITDRIQKAILDLPARAIPTFSKQIADMVDGTQRTSFEYGQPVKSAINSAKAKLPFVSKELTPVVDTLGNEVEKYGGENNWFNVFFNPANMNKGKKTKAGEEIYNVYQETGDTTIFPVTAPYYVNQDGAKITMDSKQRAEYQKTAGDYTEETVNKLINDSDYQKLDDPEKAEILSQVVKDSNEKAKRDVLNINNKSSDLELIDKVGADYYTYKIATKGMSKQGEKCEALEKKDYSNQNKQLIYESEINKEDKTFEGLKKINKNFNMDEYLKYKSQNFSGDNKKEDTINYVNGLDLDGIERLYIIGRTYKLNKTEKQQLETLLRNKMPSQDMLDILQTIK